MDAQQQLVWDSEISAVVLGNGEEFVLVPLDEDTPDSLVLAAARGFSFCGVLGYKDGAMSARPEPHPDATCAMTYASFAFAQYVAARIGRGDNSADWLEELWKLSDSREA